MSAPPEADGKRRSSIVRRSSSAALRPGTTIAVERADQPSGIESTTASWNTRRSEARNSLVTRGVINVRVVGRA